MNPSPFNLQDFTLSLNLQDCFFPQPEFPKSPISQETWHNWFQTWSRANEIEGQWRQMGKISLEGEKLRIANCELRTANCELTLRLSDDREIQSLNARYRDRDTPTDVLAFAALEGNFPENTASFPDEPLYLGDIIISVETASHQARQQGHSLAIELAWLASHGFLHLLGWDHPDDESLSIMLDRQRNLLQLIGLVDRDR